MSEYEIVGWKSVPDDRCSEGNGTSQKAFDPEYFFLDGILGYFHQGKMRGYSENEAAGSTPATLIPETGCFVRECASASRFRQAVHPTECQDTWCV